MPLLKVYERVLGQFTSDGSRTVSW